MDTAYSSRNLPINHLLQGLHTIYAHFVSLFSIVFNDRIFGIEKFLRDSVISREGT